jgi:hypothetical protein
MDYRDFGMKIGDTIRAVSTQASREAATGPAGRGGNTERLVREGVIGARLGIGMTLEQNDAGDSYAPLGALHDFGWEFELLNRPLLNDRQRAVANALDDPATMVAFADLPYARSEALVITERVMAAVGHDTAVIVLPVTTRDLFMSMAGGPREYLGPLPELADL